MESFCFVDNNLDLLLNLCRELEFMSGIIYITYWLKWVADLWSRYSAQSKDVKVFLQHSSLISSPEPSVNIRTALWPLIWKSLLFLDTYHLLSCSATLQIRVCLSYHFSFVLWSSWRLPPAAFRTIALGTDNSSFKYSRSKETCLEQ